MYRKFYGLKDRPFNSVPDPGYLYLSPNHKEALDYLKTEVERGSNPVVFTGDIGSGKTVLLRAFLKSLEAGSDIIQILYRGNDRAEFLQMILLEMGTEPESDGVEDLRSEIDARLRESLREGREVFLVIDEAQELGTDALDEVCRLSGLQEDGRRLVRVVMTGLPVLRERLSASGCGDAPGAPYHLRGLPDEEIPGYIRHRLAIAGCTDTGIFPDDVLREISRFSKGIPRLINMICDAALLYGHFSEKKVLTMPLLKEVIADVFDNANTEESYQYETASVASSYVSTDADYEAGSDDHVPSQDVDAEKAHGDEAVAEAKSVPEVCSCHTGPIPMTVLLLERNARMRVRLEDRFTENGVSTVVLSTLDELFRTLESANDRGLQVLVADASFFFAKGGTEDPEGKKALDRIQRDHAYLPLIVTATLPLTVIRTKLFQRGIPLLLYKPDLNRIDLSEVHTQFDGFFDELQRCLSNIHSQFEAICQKTIRWLTEPQASDKSTE
ncbi:MAG TPA: hypothetical protein ENJ04_00660 [Nitrospirae bacterium]|nr:hypothetical protein [Nitrospirota bacterium]